MLTLKIKNCFTVSIFACVSPFKNNLARHNLENSETFSQMLSHFKFLLRGYLGSWEFLGGPLFLCSIVFLRWNFFNEGTPSHNTPTPCASTNFITFSQLHGPSLQLNWPKNLKDTPPHVFSTNEQVRSPSMFSLNFT